MSQDTRKVYGIDSYRPSYVETGALLDYIKAKLYDVNEATKSVDAKTFKPSEVTDSLEGTLKLNHLKGMKDVLQDMAIDISLGKIK